MPLSSGSVAFQEGPRWRGWKGLGRRAAAGTNPQTPVSFCPNFSQVAQTRKARARLVTRRRRETPGSAPPSRPRPPQLARENHRVQVTVLVKVPRTAAIHLRRWGAPFPSLGFPFINSTNFEHLLCSRGYTHEQNTHSCLHGVWFKREGRQPLCHTVINYKPHPTPKCPPEPSIGL